MNPYLIFAYERKQNNHVTGAKTTFLVQVLQPSKNTEALLSKHENINSLTEVKIITENDLKVETILIEEFKFRGQPFYDPLADGMLIDNLTRELNDTVEVRELDMDINDPRFPHAMADRLIEYIEARSSHPGNPGGNR